MSVESVEKGKTVHQAADKNPNQDKSIKSDKGQKERELVFLIQMLSRVIPTLPQIEYGHVDKRRPWPKRNKNRQGGEGERGDEINVPTQLD